MKNEKEKCKNNAPAGANNSFSLFILSFSFGALP